MNERFGWIGVDFDGTLATYEKWIGAGHVGEAIAPMVDRVRAWIDDGWEVRIFTARIYPYLLVRPTDIAEETPMMSHLSDGESASLEAIRAIQQFCVEHLGRALTVTCVKDYGMVELWDDRAVQVNTNTGLPVGTSSRGL